MRGKLTQRESLGLVLAALAIAAVLVVMALRYTGNAEVVATTALPPVAAEFDSITPPAPAKKVKTEKKISTQPKQRNHLNETF